MRISRASGSSATQDLHPDLAARLADEATRIAGHFVNICIRALDYCPPVDMQFGEFLRAVVTADYDLVPDDPHGYRAEIIKAFRLRGIIPESVKSYSEEALRWCPPEVVGKPIGSCKGLEYSIRTGVDDFSRSQATEGKENNLKILHRFATENAAALNLDPTVPIQVASDHPIHRISPDGRIIIDFVVEFLQMKSEPLNADVPDGPKITFRGGSSVIFDQNGNVRYVIFKRIAGQSRLEKQRAFAMQAQERCACAPYAPAALQATINFQAVHKGF